MKSVEFTNWSKESFITNNELSFRCIVLNEPTDSHGNPLSGPNNYGIYSKMKSSKPVHLKFTGNSTLEVEETGILGITLMNGVSENDNEGNRLAVLNITSQYRKDF